MQIPTISDLAGMDDAALAEFLGQPAQLQSFKEEVTELNSLKGEARAEAEKMLRERLSPSISSESLRWLREDAVRATKTPEEELQDTSPSSIAY